MKNFSSIVLAVGCILTARYAAKRTVTYVTLSNNDITSSVSPAITVSSKDKTFAPAAVLAMNNIIRNAGMEIKAM